MRRIRCRTLEAKEFARFGEVIDVRGRAPELINEGATERFPDLAAFDAGDGFTRAALGIYPAKARGFPLRIAALERHWPGRGRVSAPGAGAYVGEGAQA